jgi:hypothetical protein
MSDYTTTPNHSFYLPVVDADDGAWGGHINSNTTALDTLLGTSGNVASGTFLPLNGGTMNGMLTLFSNPSGNMDAASKQYVDSVRTLVTGSYLPLSGGTMTGPLTLSADPTTALQASTKQYVDARSSANVGRNRLHNSGFRINQRSYVSGTALAAAAYGHDRWKAGAGGCTYTFTQAQPATTITITAGTLQQIIDATDVEGGSYMLSWTGTAQGRVNAGTYAASPVAVIGLAANTTITVEFNAGTLGTVQFEAGTVATAYERQQYSDDLRHCQRFYQAGSWLLYGYNTASQGVAHGMGLPVTMRATPTMTNTVTASTNASGITIGVVSPSAVQVYANATATGSLDAYGTFTASADF